MLGSLPKRNKAYHLEDQPMVSLQYPQRELQQVHLPNATRSSETRNTQNNRITHPVNVTVLQSKV